MGIYSHVSRAFVKEDDGAEQPMALPQTGYPNYVTVAGLAQLRERLDAARASGSEREIEHWGSRVDSAIVVPLEAASTKTVKFGATVTIESPDRTQRTYAIVGEDEADPLRGTISWISPLGQALIDSRVGKRVLWKRPAGDLAVRILAIEYR